MCKKIKRERGLKVMQSSFPFYIKSYVMKRYDNESYVMKRAIKKVM